MGTGPRGEGPAPGSEFAGHRIEAILGEGGMGVVYRARNLALDRVRALKVVAPSLSADARFRDRFRRESRLAASIEHPNVIPVHEAGERDGHLYLSMRLVEGHDLRELIGTRGPLDPGRAAEVVRAIAAGLDAAHAAGLIHRDVKPANILVGEGTDAGRVYLTDFGISRTTGAGETVTSTGELIGTADFVAPEQISGAPVDHRADIYALGAVLHYALTGRSPFPRENELAVLFAHANAPRPRPSESDPSLPPELDAVVARAMAIDPDERFESAGALSRSLDGALERRETVPLVVPPVTEDTPPVQPPEPPPGRAEPPPRSPRRRPLAIGLGLAAIAAVVVAIVLIGGGGPGDDVSTAALVAEPPIDVGHGPTAVAIGPERVWVAARDAGEVDAVDQVSNDIAFRIPVPAPSAIAVGFGSVWAVSKASDTLYRLDPLEGRRPLEIPLGHGADPSDVAVDSDWVWVANAGTQSVVRISPDTDTAVGNVPLGTEPRAIATGEGSVWVTNVRSASVSRIDPSVPERQGSSIPVGELPNDIAVGQGAVWVTSNLNGTVTRIDPATNRPDPDPIAVGNLPRGIAAGLGYIWVALGGDNSVVRIDPDARALAGPPVEVGNDPSDIALAPAAAWTSSEGDSTITRLNP
jgi:DNA-binding beta-propeller fold protein YncE